MKFQVPPLIRDSSHRSRKKKDHLMLISGWNIFCWCWYQFEISFLCSCWYQVHFINILCAACCWCWCWYQVEIDADIRLKYVFLLMMIKTGTSMINFFAELATRWHLSRYVQVGSFNWFSVNIIIILSNVCFDLN